MRVRSVIISWDTAGGCVGCALAAGFLPRWVPSALAQDFYRVGISVLAILFSVFFAALAVIISATNDDFVRWLDSDKQASDDGDFAAIVSAFRFSLVSLFVALTSSLLLYAYTSVRIANAVKHQHKCFAAVFAFLFFYGLFTAGICTLNAITFSRLRSRYAHSVPREGHEGKSD
jgi:energy-coupling factor transporter transmembrane protein EcfT